MSILENTSGEGGSVWTILCDTQWRRPRARAAHRSFSVSQPWSTRSDVSLGTKCGCWGSNNRKLNYYPSRSQFGLFNPGQPSFLFYLSISSFHFKAWPLHYTLQFFAWSKYSNSKKWAWASGRAWWYDDHMWCGKSKESSAALQSVLQSPWFL